MRNPLMMSNLARVSAFNQAQPARVRVAVLSLAQRWGASLIASRGVDPAQVVADQLDQVARVQLAVQS